MIEMQIVEQIRLALRSSVKSTPGRAVCFFKTGVGEYAEHDQFIGVSVPAVRKIAKEYRDLSLDQLLLFLTSQINEERLLALIILVAQYKKATEQEKSERYQWYVNNLQQVNNWNLVDSSAHYIVGAYLWDKDRSFLFELAGSKNMWERRVAIVATWYFIRNHDFDTTCKIAVLLLADTHDLIHKAVGWMLREVGNRDQIALVAFLDMYGERMPRTMLRYAIEKFSQEQRKQYLAKNVKVARN